MGGGGIVSLDDVRGYYAAAAHRERERLVRSTAGRVERAVNLRVIREHLASPGRILDLGGGAGAYTLELAGDGHTVVLADLSSELLDLARRDIAADPPARERVEAVIETDARDLSAFADESFDAVLCLGPFYHLTCREDRLRAAEELARVLRPRGYAFVAYIPRTTLLRFLVSAVAAGAEYHSGVLRLAVATGIYRATEPGRFTEAYYPVPSEMQSLFSRAGIQTVRSVASEGIATVLPETGLDAWSAGEAFEELLEVCLQTAEEPTLQGATTHMLLVGRKQARAL
jgi:ubiquinone/menaquinone biosynthesis C-methylase UbiE